MQFMSSDPPKPTAMRSRATLSALLRIVVVLCQLLVWHAIARADKPVAPADLAVDQIALKGGPRLLGSILGREADGTLAIAVGREWLKKSNVKFFEKVLPEESAQTRAALVEPRQTRARKLRRVGREVFPE